MKRLITSCALSMLMLGASGIATAQTTTNYTCMEGGNPPPPSNNGNIIIKEKGPCTLDGMNYQAGVSTIGGYLQITAGGAITITTTIPGAGLAAFGPGGYVSIQGGAKTMLTGDINAQSYIYMTSKGDIDVTGTLNAVAGNILVIGQKKVATGAITGAANGGYNIDLKAEQGDSSPAAFVIDKSSSNATNGVNGTITANAGSGGAVIYITNGGAGSSGDINLKDATGLIVSGTTATGDIILNAQNGTLMMPGGANGTLSADGTGTAPAGQIQLLAQTVTFADKGIVSASQATTTAGALHGVAISAASITFGGNKLEIHADGNGGGANGAFAYLLPEGATTITDDTSNPINIPITISNTQIQGAMSITGTGNLTVTANGDQALVGVYAYPITISGAVVELQSTGTMALQHGVYVQNPGSLSGMVGLTMSGAVTLDGSAKGGGANGGLVIVSVDQTQLSGVTTLTATANGPSGARQNGPAGNIVWTSTSTLTLAGTSTFSANGAGSGAAGHLTFQAGSFAFNGTQSFTANSLGTPMGGNIYLASTATGQASLLTLGNTATLQANSSSGPGGTISIISASQPLTITGGGISVAAATAGGNGAGGTINATATNSTMTVNGTLSANAVGTGLGGQIVLMGNSSSSILLNGATIQAAADPNGNGSGNIISILNPDGGINVAGATFDANGSDEGGGGNITINSSSSDPIDFTQPNTFVNAKGGSNGAGGTVNIASAANYNIDLVIDVMPDDGSIASVAAARSGSTNRATVAPQVTIEPVFGGELIQNGVTCQTFLISGGSASWPSYYWDCVNPQTGLDQTPALWISGSTGLPASVLNTIGGTQPTVLWVMQDGLQYNQLWADIVFVNDDGLGGYTFEWPPIGNTNLIDETVFEQYTNVFGAQATVTPLQMTQNTAHELGHVFDYRQNNDQTWSQNPTFVNYVAADDLWLDYLGGNPNNGTRSPCSTNNSAPFDNVIDSSTGNAICGANGMLNPAEMYITAGMTNFQILQTTSTGIFGGVTNGKPYTEIWAESFAWMSYLQFQLPLTYTAYFEATADGVFANGFYQCALGYANLALTGNNTAPAYCTQLP